MLRKRDFQIARHLRSILPSHYQVVAEPDHPMLLRGPNLLVGGENSIAAVFTPTLSELKNSFLLRNRLALSRLALPVNCRCVLAISGFGIGDEITRHFNAIFENIDTDQALRFIQNRNDYGDVKPLPAEVKQAAKDRFDVAYRASIISKIQTEKRADVGQVHVSSALDLPRKKNYQYSGPGRTIRPKNLYEMHSRFSSDADAALIRFKGRKNPYQPLGGIIEAQSGDTIVLDSGIP